MMYKVCIIQHYQATRDVELLNETTQTKDLCFDDSALVSFANFGFMEEGKTYDCKIKLFGDVVEKESATSVEIRITNPTVFIGKKPMIEVQIDEDIYYIPRSKADNAELNDRLFFRFSRKDLIQVDDVIHNDYS